MFYSTDILSRRKSGLGIVWLAATLGDRSVIRRLSRREILGVDIAKACAYLCTPTEPLALRLSSQLLYGVVRLYGHQTELLFQDVFHVQAHIRRRVLTTVTPTSATYDIDMRTTTKAVSAITLPLDLTFFALDFNQATIELLGRWSVEPPQREEVELEDGFRTPTPARFVEAEERITLPGRAFEEEELGMPRAFGDETMPMSGEGEGLEAEALDLGLDVGPMGMEPFVPGEFEGAPREGEDESMATAPVVEWPELEDRLLEEAARLDVGPAPEGVAAITPARRAREEEQAQRRQRARLTPLEDAETMLSETQLRASRADYVARMTTERGLQQRRQAARQADATIRGVVFEPPADLALSPQLAELWQTTVGATMLSRRARFRAMRTDAGMTPLVDAPPSPPPPTPFEPMDEEELGDVGVARAASPALPAELRGARESLPWNVFMEHRRRSSMLPSVSYDRPTFERELTPVRPREVSIETPTGLRRFPVESPAYVAASPSTLAQLEEYDPVGGTPEVLRLGLPTAEAREASPTPPAQVFEGDMEEETRNFLEYARSIRRELEDPTFLFFSDLAPVAASTPAVAAQAFYHTLALASARSIRVQQDEAYQQIQITIVQP
ncbi:hypothetical protein PaG_01725 [Moesziomyces aphidis]|uniref:Rad21/Rec8-like protein N-terminal domain-containing protein n=1 Tax=Moesziomyces aphidis TaxID=84754 RepID=W3VRL1_MOEAP|nr:hypothetical protein PaG_01725 [Moesziomyces aphidis]DBA11404.1 TPA_inf: REC8 [Moesziomyces aphidis]